MLLKSLASKLGCKFVEFKTLTTCDRIVPCTAIAVNKEKEGEGLIVIQSVFKLFPKITEKIECFFKK